MSIPIASAGRMASARRLAALLASCGIVALVAGCGDSTGTASSDGGSQTSSTDGLTFGMVQQQKSPFFDSAVKGAQAKGRELGVVVTQDGPPEVDTAQQVADVRSLIVKGVDGIILSPNDPKALLQPIREAEQAGIPVVIYNSALSDEGLVVSSVLSDDEEGGRLAGEFMCERLGSSGEVFMAEAVPGLENITARWNGFKAAIRTNCPGVTVQEQLVGCEPAQAQAKVQSALVKNPDIKGFFADAECTGIATASALKGQGADRPVMVSFDAAPALVKALQAGELDAIVAQQAAQEGATAVEHLVAHVNGEHVPPRTLLENVLMTQDNFDQTGKLAYGE